MKCAELKKENLLLYTDHTLGIFSIQVKCVGKVSATVILYGVSEGACSGDDFL